MENVPDILWLIWHNEETEQCYHVGNLISHQDGTYTFTYELSGKPQTLTAAMQNGYKPHLHFVI